MIQPTLSPIAATISLVNAAGYAQLQLAVRETCSLSAEILTSLAENAAPDAIRAAVIDATAELDAAAEDGTVTHRHVTQVAQAHEAAISWMLSHRRII